MKFQTYKVVPKDSINKVIQIENISELSNPDTLLLIQVEDTNPDISYDVVDALGAMGIENVVVAAFPITVKEIVRELTLNDEDNIALGLLEAAVKELEFCQHPDFGKPELLIERIRTFLETTTDERETN